MEGAHLHGEHGEHLAVLGEIGRKEQHDEDLRDLTRLEAQAADGKPDAAAVDLGAHNGQHGGKQQDDADDHQGVLILCDLVEVLYQQQRGHHGDDTHEEPDDLLACQVGIDAGNEGNADATESEDDGQNCRIRIGRKLSYGQMGGEERYHQANGH